jgi:glyoxylase-like metal-dependent hydrolase (beta-lactamase superfamily II)
MRIINLTSNEGMAYSSNVYLILGNWSEIKDVNTLVDVGNDPAVIDRIRIAPTGLGKKTVDQVILTHGHFDHTTLLPTVRDLFRPKVYAYSASTGADTVLTDGQTLRCGDRMFQIIHMPGHSEDSICLYCEEEGVLFAGDSPLIIRSVDSSYDERFVRTLEQLTRKKINTIYFGHGKPIYAGARDLLIQSLRNLGHQVAPAA